MRTKTTPRRKTKPRYKALLDLPPLTPEEYEGLKASIAVNGVINPILVDSDGPTRRIIDGNHRKKISDSLGYECPETVHEGDEEELRALARALNLARRHLTQAQKRQLIADQLAETPERSDRWVGKMLGVSHPTVASVRGEIAATGKVCQLAETVGMDGKFRPRPFFGGCNQANTKRNDVRTPDGLCQFLHDLISPHYPARLILDPCAGDGALTRPWKGARINWYEIKRGRDFFKRRKPLLDVELVLANVPFSGNPSGKELFPTKFLAKILKIVPEGCPIVFFAPFHFLLNSRVTSNDYAGRPNRYKWLREVCPPITSIIPLPQDAYCVDGVGPLVHSMVLLFNMPKLLPCIYVPGEYLGW
ncbi:MAG: ParB/RepB/Spo0J family partition protein [Thermoguttaceae bacterium]|jgi:hypothetical protein|nr:ParB/RepB/Spo0J family partition protein [Thermoguttaceae bacterium]